MTTGVHQVTTLAEKIYRTIGEVEIIYIMAAGKIFMVVYFNFRIQTSNNPKKPRFRYIKRSCIQRLLFANGFDELN
jgi:hypothetical protein